MPGGEKKISIYLLKILLIFFYMKKLFFFFFFLIVFNNRNAFATCECMCVNGKMQPICESALDIPLPCVGICSIAPPSVPPIQTPTIPPIGTSKCVQKQIKNPYSGIYEWRTVCN